MKYLRDVESKQYMSSTRPTMNDVFEEHFGTKHSSGGEVEYDQLSLGDFDLSQEFECVYKHFPDITLQRIRANEWMIWYKGLNVTEEVYHNRTECLTNNSLRQIHRFVQDCTKTNNTFTVITETGIKIEHIGRIDYKKKSLHQNVKSYDYNTKQVSKKTQCSHCKDSGKLLVHNVEQTVWNGIPINIHQQQEMPCTCNF